MTSEIKVDTISEQTSANGVTIDGLTIKDGNIIGDVALAGTTPTFTVGDGGAEDAALIFDGNAVDYYIALDDSADNLIIGSGSTVGSNSLITIDSNGDFTLDSAGDVILDADGGDIRFKDGGTEIAAFENSSSDLQIKASVQDKDIIFRGNDGGSGINALTLDMSDAGKATFNNHVVVSDRVVGSSNLILVSTDSNEKIHMDAGGFIKFETDGSEAVRIDSSQRVGIGTSSPTTTLSVNGIITHTGGTASSTSDLTSGGLHFHDASTADGAIMPITFTPSATADRARAGIGFISVSAGGSAGFAADIAFYTRSAADGTTLGTSDERARIDSDGRLSLGETLPDVTSGGICLNQGANDAKILTLKSSDVAHGMTDVAETDTYGVFTKRSSDGGLHIKGLHDSGDQAIRLEAMCVTENSTKSTSGNAPMHLISGKKNNLGLQAFGSNANLFVVSNNGNTKFIVDAEGELHSDGGAQSAYDTYEDAHLVRAYDLSHGNGVINSQFDKFISYNHEALAEAKLVGREENGTPNHFVNVTGMQRLHNGAIWQQYEKHQRLAEAVYEMAKETLGEDKADAILKKHDIKLLN